MAIVRRCSGWTDRFWRHRDGLAAVELSLTLPLVLIVMVGAVEASRHLVASKSLDAATAQLGDLVTREQTMDRARLTGLFAAVAGNLAADFESKGVAIVSSVTGQSGAGARIDWQERGAGELEAESRLGLAGGPADLPDALSLTPGESVVAVEIFYVLSSGLAGLVPDTVVRKTGFYVARSGDLSTLGAD